MSNRFIKEQSQVILESIADELIPAYEDMPSAIEANVITGWAEEVLKLRHDLREPFSRALRQIKQLESLSPQERLENLQRDDVEAFNALGVVLAGGYFLNPDVRSKIGYPGQTSRVDYEAEVTPDYVKDGLLDPVLKRGPIYTKV